MSVNINEILATDSNYLAKRRLESSLNNGDLAKRAKTEAANLGSFVKMAPEELLKAVDESSELEALDDRSVRKMIGVFEKRVLKNQEMRIKFADQPEKFMESEIELNVAIQELHSLAAAPQFYSLLAEANMIENFLFLLNHENTDISCALAHLLQELTDIDALNENEESAELIANLLLEGQVIGGLCRNLERLNESSNKDEADGIYNTIAVIENLFELKSDVLLPQLLRYGFLTWLLKRLKTKMPFDANSLYCSEILAVLLQNSDDFKKALGSEDGVDVLLQALAFYKRHNPVSADEIEFMENLFNCLCACLMLKENLKKFLDGEGLQLMNLMLREKKMSRESALKVLVYATNGRYAKENCDKFVDILGLRTLFPLFMKTPAKHKRKGHSAEEHEERICSVMASLLKYCSSNQKSRVLSKFVESDGEKVERLMELHFKYLDKVQKFEAESDKRFATIEDDEDEIYLKKLDAGLFTLQLVDFLILEIYANGASIVKDRISKILSMKRSSMDAVKKIVRKYIENLGVADVQDKSDDKTYLSNLLAKVVAINS